MPVRWYDETARKRSTNATVKMICHLFIPVVAATRACSVLVRSAKVHDQALVTKVRAPYSG